MLIKTYLYIFDLFFVYLDTMWTYISFFAKVYAALNSEV